MRRVFVDTAYLQAILLRRDQHHDAALQLGIDLEADEAEYVTTNLVIAELLASISRFGPEAREQAVGLVDDLISQQRAFVYAFDEALFARALALFKARRDTRYSLADCAAMVVCRDQRITDVLTSDADFTHEGLTILLRNDRP